jgi:hypothetical protein
MRKGLADFLRKPFFLSPHYWRYKVQHQTCKILDDPEKVQSLRDQAAANLARWHKQSDSPYPKHVTVVNQDWGDTAFEKTRKFGKLYAVLSNASAQFAGGAFLGCGSALEENMWARTTCPTYVQDQLMQGDQSQVRYDENANAFLYEEVHSDLIAGQVLMDEQELRTLRRAIGSFELESAHKTFLNTKPEICFRGSEFFREPTLEMFNGRVMEPDPGLSFQMLEESNIYPFIELRSAALDRSNPATIQGSDEQEMKKRIESQLDTMIVAGIRHAILGAFGTGCYDNDPEMVATLYREALRGRLGCFDDAVFPILGTGVSTRNYNVFYSVLDGLPLGKTPINGSKLFQAKTPPKKEASSVETDSKDFTATVASVAAKGA